jgi:hypothetical protein
MMILLALGFCKGFFYLVVQSVLDDFSSSQFIDFPVAGSRDQGHYIIPPPSP